MRLYEIQTQQYVFHETHELAAVNILQQKRIKGLWVDNPEAEEDMKNDLPGDYGHYVYTTYADDDNTYYGVAENNVMFVINISKAPKGEYSPEEGGLYAIPKEVPISAIELVAIISSISNKIADKIFTLSAINGIKAIENVSREQIINKFK